IGDREFTVAEDERRAVGGSAALHLAHEEPVIAVQHVGPAFALEPGQGAVHERNAIEAFMHGNAMKPVRHARREAPGEFDLLDRQHAYREEALALEYFQALGLAGQAPEYQRRIERQGIETARRQADETPV